jgi:hypothetical protein
MRKGLERHGGTRREARLTCREAASQIRSHFILFYFQFCEVGGDHPQRTYSNLATGQRGTWQMFRNPVYCTKSGYFTIFFPENLPTLGHFRPHPNTWSTLVFVTQVQSGENSPQADCDFKENSLKCSRLGPVIKLPPKLCFSFLPTLPLQTRPDLQRGVAYLDFHYIHSSIFFSVSGGNLIFGN